jgi:hypothetical protein
MSDAGPRGNRSSSRSLGVIGWIAVGASTLIASYWAWWGILENFHEGWWQPSIWLRLGALVGMYLLFTNIFVAAGLIAIRWPRIGGGLHIVAGMWAWWFFRAASLWLVLPLMVVPLTSIGLAYWLGRPQPRWLAAAVLTGLPLLTIVLFGIEPAWRVSRRLDDGDRGPRRLTGSGVDLVWAPQGPGWPMAGVSWHEANRICRYLHEDGLSLSDEPVNIWRLPTAEEAVRSMHRHGRNCGGKWDAVRRVASYDIAPDKESPLWDGDSQIVYWWTATELNAEQALIIVYDGKTWPRPKNFRPGYLGFRAVKEPAPATER